jgi:hypothetical protein
MSLEKLNSWWPPIAILVSLLSGIFLAKWRMDASRKLARDTGAFDRPDLRCFLNNNEISPSDPVNIAFACPKKEGTLHLVPLAIMLGNVGKKSAQNIGVDLRFQKHLRMIVPDSLISKEVNSLRNDVQVERKSVTLGNHEFAAYTISMLNPTRGAHIVELVPIESTHFNDTISATTKDGHMISFALSVNYGINGQITVSAKDIQSVDYNVILYACDVATMDNLQSEILSREAAATQEVWDGATFLEKLALIFSTRQTKYQLVCPQFSYLNAGPNSSLAVPGVDQTTTRNVVFKKRFYPRFWSSTNTH